MFKDLQKKPHFNALAILIGLPIVLATLRSVITRPFMFRSFLFDLAGFALLIAGFMRLLELIHTKKFTLSLILPLSEIALGVCFVMRCFTCAAPLFILFVLARVYEFYQYKKSL